MDTSGRNPSSVWLPLSPPLPASTTSYEFTSRQLLALSRSSRTRRSKRSSSQRSASDAQAAAITSSAPAPSPAPAAASPLGHHRFRLFAHTLDRRSAPSEEQTLSFSAAGIGDIEGTNFLLICMYIRIPSVLNYRFRKVKASILLV